MVNVGGKRRWLPPSKSLIYMVKSYLAEEVGFSSKDLFLKDIRGKYTVKYEK